MDVWTAVSICVCMCVYMSVCFRACEMQFSSFARYIEVDRFVALEGSLFFALRPFSRLESIEFPLGPFLSYGFFAKLPSNFSGYSQETSSNRRSRCDLARPGSWERFVSMPVRAERASCTQQKLTELSLKLHNNNNQILEQTCMHCACKHSPNPTVAPSI